MVLDEVEFSGKCRVERREWMDLKCILEVKLFGYNDYLVKDKKRGVKDFIR